jgi:hypothetical protein
MGGPDKIFGAGKRDGASVASADRELPPADQRAYRVVEPGRAQTPSPAKVKQRKASRATGVRNPEPSGDGEK